MFFVVALSSISYKQMRWALVSWSLVGGVSTLGAARQLWGTSPESTVARRAPGSSMARCSNLPLRAAFTTISSILVAASPAEYPPASTSFPDIMPCGQKGLGFSHSSLSTFAPLTAHSRFTASVSAVVETRLLLCLGNK